MLCGVVLCGRPAQRVSATAGAAWRYRPRALAADRGVGVGRTAPHCPTLGAPGGSVLGLTLELGTRGEEEGQRRCGGRRRGRGYPTEKVWCATYSGSELQHCVVAMLRKHKGGKLLEIFCARPVLCLRIAFCGRWTCHRIIGRFV